MMADKALIIIAHGSRKDSSNEEVKALGEKVKYLQDKHYAFVMTAFLEFSDPSLEESMLSCIDKGANEIVILPYFLASGNHVTRDIPEVVQNMQASYPQVKITLKEHVGSSPGMVDLLSDMAISSNKKL
ncbi:CbiX/SirB N-terminal domain-containing protein [Sulfurovum sp. XGS-02]|uniref:sirohydrochlorin chelatase n=1 Tax=Sulfurovum sp. XGS-02 TaxID=2925411 RepID=UPI0020692DFA|nr:CbiX/SirB N-terminal domain-containing protein [Sulfurovum sp. XGS-02]UPT78411.1 CbiX/SirB N-terminal domain-containing protein [Sulfurovum sp. XGS-02]